MLFLGEIKRNQLFICHLQRLSIKHLCSVTYDAIWLSHILENILKIWDKKEGPTSIKLENNLVYYARSKKIESQHHLARENIQSQKIELEYYNTNENMADVFTKLVGKMKLLLNKNMLGVHQNLIIL